MKLAVVTVDGRPYVVKGREPPEYVGIVSGGVGNPFNRDTQAGKPLADGFSAGIVSSLAAKGCQVTAVNTPSGSSPAVVLAGLLQSGAHGLILLELRDWQNGTMINPTLNCAVPPHTYDSSGWELASVQDTENFDMHVGGIFNTPGKSSDKVYRFHEHKIVEWFSNPKIAAAIHG